jgi:hypothetical protein
MKKSGSLTVFSAVLLALFCGVNNLSAQYGYSTTCFTSFTGTNGFSTGDYPYDIVSADFNGDGNKDLATANLNSQNISVLMGTGTGSFLAAVHYSATTSLNNIVTADFNNDGAPDIAVAGNSGVIHMYLNSGSGTFTTVTQTSGAGTVSEMLAADFNSDGNTDLARVDQSAGTIRVFLGTGSGSLTPVTAVSTSVAPNGLAKGDFNGDGFLDLAVSSISPREARLFIGNNAGSFTLSSVTSVGGSFNYPVSIISGDFNSDGHMDAMVGTSGGYGWPLYGNGTGTIVSIDLIGMPQEPRGLATADVDLDGKLDAVAVGNYQPGLQIHVQNGSSFNTMTNLYIGNSTDPLAVAAADLNNDGRPDFASANRTSDNIHVYLSKIPSLSVTPNTTICAGQSVTIAISTAGSYSWSTGSNNTSSIVATPSLSTWYTFTGTTGDGCYALMARNITVISSPTITVNSGSICAGNNFTITPSGAVNYTISGGSSVVSPASTTAYTVTGSDSFGCLSTGTAVANVTVHALPVISVNSGSICTGNSFTIVPTGAGTYTISGGAAVVSPTTNTNYTVTAKSSVGCPASNTAVASISVSPEQVPVISVNSGSVCIGQTFSMTPSGASSYTFSNGSNLASPVTTTNYFVSGTSTAGCVSATPAVAGVTVMNLPTVTVNSGTICLGGSFTINPSGAVTYNFEGGSSTVSPTSTRNYSVTGTDNNGCTSPPALSNVTVHALPVVSVNNGSLCSGNSLVLLPSGAQTYSITGNTFTVSPTADASYSVAGTSSVGCLSSNTAVAQVTVHALPVVSVNSGTICSGKSFTMQPSGAQTYSVTGNNFTVSPNTSLSYSVTGSSSVGCLSSNTAVANVTVFTTPVVSVNSGSLCAGQQFTIVPAGAASFAVAGGNTVVAPNSTSSYTVTGTSTAGCLSSNTATSTITVHQLPVVTVNSGSICAGQNFTIVPAGAALYGITGGTNVVSPSADAAYSVTGTSSVGCVSSNTAVASVSVYALPVITVNSGTVCSGSVFTLTPSGASNYIYSGGSNTVAPTSNSTYFVSGTSSVGCASSNTAVSNVTIVALPVVVITGPPAICIGQGATLTANGASTYIWNNSANTGTIAVSPLVLTGYSVTGTDLNACKNTATYTLAVNPLPSVSATANSTVVCYGSSVTLNGGGATTYQWTGGVVNNVPFSATATTIYTVTGINLQNCQGVAIIVITVNNLPVVTASSANTVVCAGKSITLIGAGANSYNWTGGITNGVAFFPTAGAGYTVTGTDANGCSATAQVSVGVNPLPIITASSNPDTICAGESVVLSADGANFYLWSTGDQTKTITQVLSGNTTFTVSGTDVNGCMNAKVFTQIVDACTSISQNSRESGSEIYPNPNNGSFRVKLVNEASARLFIYDDAGKTVESRMIMEPHMEIKVPHLANGIYHVRIVSESGAIITRRLIKQ